MRARTEPMGICEVEGSVQTMCASTTTHAIICVAHDERGARLTSRSRAAAFSAPTAAPRCHDAITVG